jgi:DNA-binding transcriptional LysR family regulator
MQKCSTERTMNWDDTRIFLGIYRAGTLRGAAAQLGIDQATAGRRLAALEATLNAKLFLRTSGGYVPTPAGEQAARAAGQMEAAAHQIERDMQGIDNRLSGQVRLATTDTMAQSFVLAALRLLHRRHPEIRVVLQVTTAVSSLTRREADLAVRTLKPTDPDLVSRHLARRESGLYASRAYLDERGMPRPDAGLAGHDLVIYHASVAPRQASHVAGVPVAGARVALEVNTGLMLLEAARLGIGIAELPVHMADADPGLVRIFPDRQHHYDMYLVLHGDLHRSARVRAVADAIVESVP